MIGKGIVGWKAPPKQEPRKEIAKVVTQTQLESAKRLSQGLSVAQLSSANANSVRNRHMSLLLNTQQQTHSAVLVMDEYDVNIGLFNANTLINGSTGVGPPAPQGQFMQQMTPMQQMQIMQNNGMNGMGNTPWMQSRFQRWGFRCHIFVNLVIGV
jgi:hypothetical protein